jgi:hypothetical protein
MDIAGIARNHLRCSGAGLLCSICVEVDSIPQGKVVVRDCRKGTAITCLVRSFPLPSEEALETRSTPSPVCAPPSRRPVRSAIQPQESSAYDLIHFSSKCRDRSLFGREEGRFGQADCPVCVCNTESRKSFRTNGWEAGTRTPIRRSRVCSLTIRRPPNGSLPILAEVAADAPLCADVISCGPVC